MRASHVCMWGPRLGARSRRYSRIEVSTRVAEQVGFVRGVNLSSEKMGLSYKNRVGQHEWSEFMLEFITHLLGVERMGAVNGT